MAMSDAKTSTTRVRLYDPELDTDGPRRLTLVSDLRAAVQQGQLEVHVQPQARLPHGRVTSVEALVRWQHPQLGWVGPEEFIPVAERTGLIGPLTHAGARHVAGRLRAVVGCRPRPGRRREPLRPQPARGRPGRRVAGLLQWHGVPAHRLTLEVTEGAVMADPTRGVSLLHDLRTLGVRLSVDDFGTGYSSLSYLQRLPVQEVKIDRSFVAGLDAAPENFAIVRAIIDLGRTLGLEVVAEGVEDEATWDVLEGLGCDLVQGWHLARAMPVDELLPWLTAREADQESVVFPG